MSGPVNGERRLMDCLTCRVPREFIFRGVAWWCPVCRIRKEEPGE